MERYTGRFDIAPVPTFNYGTRAVAANLLNDPTSRRERRPQSRVRRRIPDTDPAQEELLTPWPETAATWSWSATPTSPSTVSGELSPQHPQLPDRSHPTGDPAPVVALHTRRRSAELLWVSRLAHGCPPSPGPRRGSTRTATSCPPKDTPTGSSVRGKPGPRSRCHRDLLRRAHLIDERLVAHGSPCPLQTRRPRTAALIAADVPVTVDGDDLPLASEPLCGPCCCSSAALHPERLDEEAAHNR